MQVSKPVTIKKLLDKMNKWYFEKNGELHPPPPPATKKEVLSLPPDPLVTASVALVFHSISRRSPDTAGSLMTDFIPLVFLAMHTKTTDEGLFCFYHVCVTILCRVIEYVTLQCKWYWSPS